MRNAPATSECALFLDFDGTLADIVERPEAVAIDPALLPILARLQERLNGALAIISGRPIAFLDRTLAPRRFDIAGLHGLEHRIGNELSLCDPKDHPDLRDMVHQLHEAVLHKPGLLIEDKGCSVALHWRLAPHEKDFARATAQAAIEALGTQYRIQYGKAVAEIVPRGAGKGSIIEHFLQHPPYRGRSPVFIGDDLTDENGFEVVNDRGGLSVRVGAGETVALQRVGTPSELRHLLSIWAATGAFSFHGREGHEFA